MSGYEKKQLELEFKKFTAKNFERPAKCSNLGQIRFYIKEISEKITELKNRFNYVPDSAYKLLHQYNAKQNTMVFSNFQQEYQ